MRLPSGFSVEVKNQADIVRIVSDYVALTKRGANHIARCPFHSEKTPSFNVHQGKGIYKCFGCGAGGSVFDFVMQIEGCGFPEAVRIVAQKSGIPIPAVEETEDRKRSARDRDAVMRLNSWAAEFFASQLERPEAATARVYVESRGISADTRATFRIGYAPDRWDGLTGHLKQKGASIEEIGISGLVVTKEQGGFYDRFRGRIMFPITDSQNRVIAFGGRVMDQGEPKYLNSPETAVYTKGSHLYGLAHSREHIRRAGFAILVEGYLDCIIPIQAGIGNVVASLGTALTEAQVRLLRRYMDKPRIVVNFDPDSAGQAATMRSIDLFLAEGFKVDVLQVPTDEDPDEFVRSHGAERFKSVVSSAQPYIEYIIERAMLRYDNTKPSTKIDAINTILPHLNRMPDKVGRAGYAEQIADRLKVDSRIIREELKRAATNRYTALDPKRVRAAEEVTKAERQLIELLLASGEVREAIVPNLNQEDYVNLATGGVLAAIVKIEQEGSVLDYGAISQHLEDESEIQLLPELMIGDLAWVGADDFDTLFKKATQALTSLKRKTLEKKLDAIQIGLADAERDGKIELVTRLFQEKAEIKKRMLLLVG
jgi:DNA primase